MKKEKNLLKHCWITWFYVKSCNNASKEKKQRVNQSPLLSFQEYQLKREEVYPIIYWLLIEIQKINEKQFRIISKELVENIKDEYFIKELIANMDSQNISLEYPN